eukprot:CAMPEP_0177680864 /NCGR_PEP_ID=MMETSP0447-20121125/30400_1 /TAXON_ID=0 /ORGANISM="Stygamoeba regulata, Strain BSH-02190019" /LENGTH=34 /DNA_ID= /DNA_START= /DNA_END= /DNA_ORIENTATION=
MVTLSGYADKISVNSGTCPMDSESAGALHTGQTG